MSVKLLNEAQLASEKNINKSSSQHHRNVIDHKFPAPIKVGGRNAWIESEIDAYIRVEIAKRDHRFLADDLADWVKKQLTHNENPWSISKVEAWLDRHVMPKGTLRAGEPSPHIYSEDEAGNPL